MRPNRRLIVFLSVLASSRLHAGEAGIVPRTELEQLEAQLDQAVAKVSRASVGIVGRAEVSRGYHVPGIGAVFVLAPRALPRSRGVVVWTQEVAPGSTVIQLEAPPPDGPPTGETPPAPDRRRVRIRTGPSTVPLDPDQARQIAEFEAQVEQFQKDAEEARLVAERELEQLAIDVQVMLGPPPSPGAVLAPEAPMAPRAVRVPAPPRSAAIPVPPPWHFWFEPREPRDPRDPDQVVADVRAAVVATLDTSGGQMTSLPPDEHVAVAVDFVAGGPFGQGRPAKTLVVRTRRKDLDERARGKLSAEELRKRMEIVEY